MDSPYTWDNAFARASRNHVYSHPIQSGEAFMIYSLQSLLFFMFGGCL